MSLFKYVTEAIRAYYLVKDITVVKYEPKGKLTERIFHYKTNEPSLANNQLVYYMNKTEFKSFMSKYHSEISIKEVTDLWENNWSKTQTATVLKALQDIQNE